MSYKPLALLLSIWMLTCALGGQTREVAGTRQFRYGILVGPGVCPIDESNREGVNNWISQLCFLMGGFASKPLNSWLNAQAEIQLVNRRAFRIFPHPQPYVYDMKVDIDAKLLRLPVSLIIASHTDDNVRTAYMGAGLALGAPLHVTMTKELRYQTQNETKKQNIWDSYSIPVIGYQAMLGIEKGQAFSELRFGRDLTSFKAPGLDVNWLQQWEIWLLLGFRLRE